MSFGMAEIYLIIINILGFMVFALDMYIYNYTSGDYISSIDTAVTIVSILGGSLGIIISIFVFCKVLRKSILMSRVFVICVFIIELTFYLIYKGFLASYFSLNFVRIFSDYKYVLYYLLIINFLSFIVYGIDKYKAINNRYRIRNITLLGLAFAGGSVGALVSMYVFRHKTKTDYYTVGVLLILAMQIIVIWFLINSKFLKL